jgi:hypothetical protein
MKGVVFTGFLEMVEARHGARMFDQVIEDARPASGGAYTAVGSYPHEEMVTMLLALSRRTGVAVPDLLRSFGQYLFGHFAAGYPSFFNGVTGAMPFLAGIEDIIHAEVLKLYPDAQLPRFDVEQQGSHRLVLVYHSARHFEDLAEGLIHGCIAHFGEKIEVQRERVGHADGTAERFVLTRIDPAA